MPLEFQKSDGPTIGIEVEVQLINQETKNLASAAIEILEEAATLRDLHLKSELSQAMMEINTDCCQTVREAGASLQKQLHQLRELAGSKNVSVAIAGTHPFQDWRERRIFPDARYFKILEKFQWLARRWTVFGVHVHVGLPDGDRAIHVMNALIPYIPHLLALSASSPFWGGTDTGLVSSRAAVLESFPTGGLPYFLLNWKEFEKYYETLVASGAIGSIKDIYWDIRPHFDFGTIEIRACDGMPTLKETLALAALIQSLVVWIDDQFQKGRISREIHMQRYWLAPENKWQAVRYGLEGQLITKAGDERSPLKEEIIKLLEVLKPVAESLGCCKELSWVGDILRKGSNAVRQRAVFARTQSLKSVVESLVEELKEGI